MQNEEHWPKLFVRRNIAIPIRSSIGHKTLKISANKLNCIYHQPGEKSLNEPKLDSNGKVFNYIELGSNFLSLSAQTERDASANPSIECQQNGVARGQQNIFKNKSQLMSDKINTFNICENCNSEPCICANKSKLICKI